MNEVLIWIKDILGQYATPIITIGTFIAGLVVTIKTFGLGKLTSALKTLISGIFGKEETSPLNVFKTELKANISNLQNDFTKVKEDLTNELSKSQTQDIILGEMLSLIVENSTLPSEIKDKFNVLKTSRELFQRTFKKKRISISRRCIWRIRYAYNKRELFSWMDIWRK